MYCLFPYRFPKSQLRDRERSVHFKERSRILETTKNSWVLKPIKVRLTLMYVIIRFNPFGKKIYVYVFFFLLTREW